MTTRILDGESVRSPIRPFVIQDFHAFVGGLISRPGMEEILRQGKAIQDRYNLRDITDGSAVADMQGPDGKPFADAAEGELRLLWALSVDWFNPYLNKIAGLSISTGSMAMSCLYLPPSMRYKTDNLYLAGIIPGPKEPKLERTNHFLCPLVDQLLVSWERGIWYNRTYDYPRGRRVRSALALVITDLPGSRKVGRLASHSAGCFCSQCHLKKQSINNIDMTTWKMKTAEEILEAAVRWRDADTQEERKCIFKEFGIRWSELNRLPYWDPVRCIVIDGMHNIFLGVTQFHSRKVIGMDVPIGDREDAGNARKIKENDLISLRRLLLKDPEPRLLLRFNKVTLGHMCGELGFRLPRSVHEMKKSVLADVLTRRTGYTQTHATIAVWIRPSASATDRAPLTSTPDTAELAPQTLIGEAYTAECAAEHAATAKLADRQDEVDSLSIRAFRKRDLKHMQADIAETSRPIYSVGPPANMGTKGQGKLKADHWKAAIEFELPVSLMKHWHGERLDNLSDESKHRHDLAHCTMRLACAVHQATSYRTTENHRTRYTIHMHAYLSDILELKPGLTLVPNHHNALHLGDFLMRFGPVHGWWMFPFERLIGVLQQVNTNYKQGQFEKTMLESFCTAANVKAFLKRDDCPKVLKDCAPIVQSCFGGDQRGTLMTDIRTLGEQILDGPSPDTGATVDWTSVRRLEREFYDVLAARSAELNILVPGWRLTRHCLLHGHLTICGT
ncbi:hypothetical protein SCP_0800590 [Sparassis crispa]|uniref:Uncharacterized protein n=1 Tax=Sparassis crispa TaxID=139825 RepID=A0A401GTJ2_9APHY|nr:hypothetical protein SCP_0800590 [Sparassis crispa]GBE85542.1 hypothetical protein SCP_0800590 [Sparassis crispa]